MLQIPLGGIRTDIGLVRGSEELRRYVRSEYGDADPSWLIRQSTYRVSRRPKIE